MLLFFLPFERCAYMSLFCQILDRNASVVLGYFFFEKTGKKSMRSKISLIENRSKKIRVKKRINSKTPMNYQTTKPKKATANLVPEFRELSGKKIWELFLIGRKWITLFLRDYGCHGKRNLFAEFARQWHGSLDEGPTIRGPVFYFVCV